MSKKHHPSQETENGMVRGLQNRHVQLIAIAGTIGTGLFLGAGRSLSLTIPWLWQKMRRLKTTVWPFLQAL